MGSRHAKKRTIVSCHTKKRKFQCQKNDCSVVLNIGSIYVYFSVASHDTVYCSVVSHGDHMVVSNEKEDYGVTHEKQEYSVRKLL